MIRTPFCVGRTKGRLLFLNIVFNMSVHLDNKVGVLNMSIHSDKKRVGNPPFQFRLDPALRSAIEKAVEQDGDGNISAWIKRIIRKELASRNVELKSE